MIAYALEHIGITTFLVSAISWVMFLGFAAYSERFRKKHQLGEVHVNDKTGREVSWSLILFHVVNILHFSLIKGYIPLWVYLFACVCYILWSTHLVSNTIQKNKDVLFVKNILNWGEGQNWTIDSFDTPLTILTLHKKEGEDSYRVICNKMKKKDVWSREERWSYCFDTPSNKQNETKQKIWYGAQGQPISTKFLSEIGEHLNELRERHGLITDSKESENV